jgi:hypothetical protein
MKPMATGKEEEIKERREEKKKEKKEREIERKKERKERKRNRKKKRKKNNMREYYVKKCAKLVCQLKSKMKENDSSFFLRSENDSS